MGLNWFKRIYVTSTNWENEQNIYMKNGGNVFNIDGKKGPYAELFNFTVTTDLRTVSDVDLGQLGGLCDTTAEVRGNTLFTYLRQKGKRDLFVTATRTMHPNNPNEMIYVTRHQKSGVALTSFFNRR